ncbi:hypothetical protein BYT27DRAFT_7250899 [Phlegmacium glaucopus]|nr:hypothetical protein BYT27DRAFT_7250899 [Phlegmacium glaucopus]
MESMVTDIEDMMSNEDDNVEQMILLTRNVIQGCFQNSAQYHQLKDDNNLNESIREDSVSDEADEDEDDESFGQWAHRYSNTPWDAEPKATTMKYYPPGWQAMLEMAKNNMRKHVALVNAFP